MGDIIAEVIAGPGEIRDIINQFRSLDGPLRPHSISAGEEESAIPLDNLAGRIAMDNRISKNIGFLLFSLRGIYLFMPQPEIGWCISVSDITVSDSTRLMKLVIDCPIKLVFACETEELRLLNRIELELAYGKEEAWVVRDLRRYIPGIYWITVVPLSRVLDENRLAALGRSTEGMNVYFGTHNVCIQLYERATDWHDRKLADKVAELLDGPVFDKAEVLSSIDGTEDFITMSNKLAKWI